MCKCIDSHIRCEFIKTGSTDGALIVFSIRVPFGVKWIAPCTLPTANVRVIEKSLNKTFNNVDTKNNKFIFVCARVANDKEQRCCLNVCFEHFNVRGLYTAQTNDSLMEQLDIILIVAFNALQDSQWNEGNRIFVRVLSAVIWNSMKLCDYLSWIQMFVITDVFSNVVSLC